ncbi:MAG: succinate dehydrogenase, cytochrome b556 subunit [Rhodospirillales bacterium]|nr:succinate dehydrogenase, cytochrome b556 subunit [Rhodospirillales bacterium]
MAAQNRPLSPHLQIYKIQITSVLSITHRLTGIALAFGAFVLAYWLISATYGPEVFQTAQSLLGSWFGKLVLLGLTFSLYFHLGNGIRHLGWDFGMGFELTHVRMTGIAVVLFAAVLTVATWFAGYAVAGGV